MQRLAVDGEARQILREWMLAVRRGGRPAPVAPPRAAEAAVPAPQQDAPADDTTPAPQMDVNLNDPVATEQTMEEDIPFFHPGSSNAEES